MKKLIFLCCLFFPVSVSAQDSLKYSKKQVADDIAFFAKSADEIHPNLYHDISKGVVNLKIDSLIKTLPDSLSLIRAYRAFAEATAFVNEGHTSVNVPRVFRLQQRSGTFNAIPLQVNDFDGKYFAANIVSPTTNVKDVKITAINGESAANIFKRLTALKGGLTSFKKTSVLSIFRFNLKVIGEVQPYTISYIDDKSVKHTVKLNDISESEYTNAITKPATAEPYMFTINNGGYGYLNFRWMNNYDRFVKFCDSVFEVIDTRKVNKLVVDLRENSGGNSALGKYLLNYIANKPYRMYGGGERKVSQQFKNQITENRNVYRDDYDDYLKLQNGTFLKMGINDLEKPEDKPHHFNGKVCFLIGPYTFSSANALASGVKDFKLATLIGEPTGEPANDYGEVCPIYLPNTNLVAFTSSTLWAKPNGDRTDTKPIAPDYLVRRTSAAGDNVLEYAVKWLDK